MARGREIILARGERIIAVVPEHCAGPGWNNRPAWVYIEQADRRLRTECLQPRHQTAELLTLFGIGAAVHQQLTRSVPTREEAPE